MHFLVEACKRKPLESKWFAYSRGATAIFMCSLFLIYLGYLISQLYYDTPLIVISSEQMSDNYHTVDAEFCIENSRLTINNCSYVNKNWESREIKNCSRFFVPENLDIVEKCYMFMANDTFKMLTSEESDPESVRRLDFYWSIDSLENVSASALSIPAISVQLYDPMFNPRRPDTIGDSPKEEQVDLYLAELSQRATNTVNQSAIINYTPQRYYGIKPKNFRAFLGLSPDYIEINTVKIQQGAWPIQDNPPEDTPPRNSYQGQVSIALAQNTIDVQKETRQHTLLADIALAGGAYGLLTTLYVVLFGMNKVSPWGLAHNTSSMINKMRFPKNEDDDFQSDNKKSKNLMSWIPTVRGVKFGVVLSSLNPLKSKRNSSSSEELFFDEENPKNVDDEEATFEKVPKQSTDAKTTSSSSTRPISIIEQSDSVMITRRSTYLPLEGEDVIKDFSAALRKEQKRSEELESRVDELEIILSQFFIDITYLNELRTKAERRQLMKEERKSKSNE